LFDFFFFWLMPLQSPYDHPPLVVVGKEVVVVERQLKMMIASCVIWLVGVKGPQKARAVIRVPVRVRLEDNR
jgi:hypothetical protein